MADFKDAAVDIADDAWKKEGVGLSGQSSTQDDSRAVFGKALPIKFWNDLATVVPPDRLVRKLLGTNTLALIYGEPGSGKTFLATDLGMHLAIDRVWFGRSVTAGAVLYVACEGVAGLSNRLAAFRRMHDLPAEVPFAVIPAAVNLGPDGQDAQRVIDAANTVKERTGQTVQLIVIDTLARAMWGGDENSAKDMSGFIRACDRVRDATEATVLIVHHSGKTKQSGARGSSALIAAVDTAIEVANDGGVMRTAKVIKQKDGDEGVVFSFALQIVEVGRDEDGEIITTCIVQPNEAVTKPAPPLTPQRARVSPQQAQAMVVLRKVLAEFGEEPPDGEPFPAAKLVALNRFREALKEARVTNRDKSSSERTQWRRIKKTLCEKGLLTVRDDYCWPT
jgi:hypothetical protein